MYQIDATFCDSSMNQGTPISINADVSQYTPAKTIAVSCSSSYVSQVALEPDQAGTTRELMVGIKGLQTICTDPSIMQPVLQSGNYFNQDYGSTLMAEKTTSRINFHICGVKAKIHETPDEIALGILSLSFLHCEYCPDGVYGESCWSTEGDKFPIIDGKIEPYYFWTE